MLSLKASLFGLLASLVLPSLATDRNIGCSKCLGASKDAVRYGCYQNCGKAFSSASHEFGVCRDYCSKFVFDHSCCSGSCPSDANTCMNNFYPPDDPTKKLRRSAEGERGHARDFVPSSDVTAVAIRHSETDLVEARDAGQICCKTASAIITASSFKLAPLLNEQRWNDDVGAGLVLISTGVALSFACSKTFQIDCLFTVPAAHGAAADVPLGGGPLPGRNEL
ncbi:uncharacterized protein JN550_012511 [Neoarthrinium moseri]|uniref:uncharacterized protein n=1 Tax=Neoarthrinium moseri TaxID=1658444 RepID=UPI001FDC0246|nr:uncharacterized protein JN550_012511 [Neoarthrinium moseri]KAI1858761.1 hypothetical protein JN550_012511 [Neoarthrinium moseri]